MRASRFDLEPRTVIPWVATLATGGIAAYFAGKAAIEQRLRLSAEKRETQLWHQATHDKLTGVLNRRGLETVLAEGNPPRAMLYADSDHLKEVNDTFGHDRGDEAIIATARLLQSSLRPGDMLARTGEGDEFLALLDPYPRRAGTKALPSQEILDSVASRLAEATHSFLQQPENADLASVGFDISVGGAVWEKGMNVDSLRAAADANMYEIKEARQGANGDQPLR